MRDSRKMFAAALLSALVLVSHPCAFAQRRASDDGAGMRRADVRAVTIPLTVRLPEKRGPQSEVQYLEALTVFEDGEKQEILSARGASRAPLTLAVLIQDDLAPTMHTEIKKVASLIRGLPAGSRVMIGYLRVGFLQVRQKFTGDLERAAKSLRVPIGSTDVSPYNPYTLTRDAIKRFVSQPVGRRAVLLISDGIDTSRGLDSSSPGQSVDLQRAIDEAQRHGVAVYSIYGPTAGGVNRLLVTNGQGSLNRLSGETGGRAYYQGTMGPLSIESYLKEIDTLLARQFALTYLSTHPEKGFHRLRIVADLAEGDVLHPAGYTR